MRISPGRRCFRSGDVTLPVLYNPAADGDARTPQAELRSRILAVDDLEAVFARARTLGTRRQSKVAGDGGLPMADRSPPVGRTIPSTCRIPFGNPLCVVDAASADLHRQAGVAPHASLPRRARCGGPSSPAGDSVTCPANRPVPAQMRSTSVAFELVGRHRAREHDVCPWLRQCCGQGKCVDARSPRSCFPSERDQILSDQPELSGGRWRAAP